MEDIGDLEDGGIAASASGGVVSGSISTERVRSRAKPRTPAPDEAVDEAAEALRWAEENIPGLDEEDVDMLVGKTDDEQARLIRTELSKLN